jgi:hypothetical protein
MLDLPRYLLGVAEILLPASFATVGAAALRARLLPAFAGAPALLATAVLALASLILTAELLGTVGLLEPLPYLLLVTLVGAAAWVGDRRGCPPRLLGFSPRSWKAVRDGERGEKQDAAARGGHPRRPSPGRGAGMGRGSGVVVVLALVVAALAVVKFGLDVKPKLTTGMTGFDSTWYHGPFAAGFFQSGNTWDLHFIAPQFLAWFYPANAEIFHGVGMLAFGRDLLSPLLNLGWFLGCLLACWSIGRPYGVAPWSLALGAAALSLPVLSDQAGEARNDIVGIFFLFAAVAIALNAWASRPRGERLGTGALIVVGLAAGLAAGTKLNFLLPAAVLVLGMTLVAPPGARWRALGVSTLAALLGGGYWYLRNLIQSGNPLPWFTDLGPFTLPGPAQELGGREGHSVLGYLFDGTVWSEWFLPGLSDGLTVLWPLLVGLALICLVTTAIIPLRCSLPLHSREKEQRNPGWKVDGALGVAGLAGLAALLAWLIAPTSASGPEGMPRGFESGLRYLAPALVLGFALLPTVPQLRERLGRLAGRTAAGKGEGSGAEQAGRSGGSVGPEAAAGETARGLQLRSVALLGTVGLVLVAIGVGYPVQRHYLENRYADSTFAAPGLNAAFKWAREVEDSRIATTTTRQYPLYGPDLSNEVQFIGEAKPDGGFVAPTSCKSWRRLLNEGDYGYAIASRDRIEPNKPLYPPAAAWTQAAASQTPVSTPPTRVYKLTLPQDPSACP